MVSLCRRWSSRSKTNAKIPRYPDFAPVPHPQRIPRFADAAQDVRNAQRTERNLKRKIQTVDLENGDLELMRLKYEDFFALAKGQIGKILQAATNMSHKKKKLQCFKEAMLMSYEDRNADPRHADMIGKKAANIINVGESVKVDMIMPGNGMNTGDDSINVGNTTNMKPEDGMIATPPRIARVGKVMLTKYTELHRTSSVRLPVSPRQVTLIPGQYRIRGVASLQSALKSRYGTARNKTWFAPHLYGFGARTKRSNLITKPVDIGFKKRTSLDLGDN